MRSNPVQARMFSFFDFTAVSVVYDCDDYWCLDIFVRSSKDTIFIYSFAFFTIYGYIMTSQRDQLLVGLMAQLVEH